MRTTVATMSDRACPVSGLGVQLGHLAAKAAGVRLAGHAHGMGDDPQSRGDEPRLVRKIGGEEGKRLHPLVSLAAILVLVAANYLVFRIFDRNYFRWYLDHGAELALALSLVAIAVDLDRDPYLVAADPGKYSGGWFAIVGETVLSLRDVVENHRVGILDTLSTVLYWLAFMAVSLCWMALVAPLQYFITLVTGAPARGAVVSRRMWVKRSGNTISLCTGPAEKMPMGAEEIGLARRPVTVTSSITAGALFVVSLLI